LRTTKTVARIGRYPLPGEDALVGRLSAAVDRLRIKLVAVDIRKLAISDYSKKYFQGTLVNGVSKLNLYAYLIYLAMDRRAPGGDLGSAGIVDYGGGNGLLAMLAREAGFAVVVYTDIDKQSAADAQVLAEAVGLRADHYVVGDLDTVASFLRTASIDCQALCSYDVIEHVYDIDAFLRGMRSVSTGALRVVHGSGANASNPRLRRRLMSAQKQVESEDRRPEWGHKPRDATSAYAKIRRDMIAAISKDLSPESVATLASRTRGMAQPDIEQAVRRFLAAGDLPAAPDHPTNTCDPYTGNWAEHLMDPYELARTLSSVGLQGRVVPGFYNPYLGWKGVAAAALNLAIQAARKRSLAMSPYYVLVGDRR
jgi:hypothetical protein